MATRCKLADRCQNRPLSIPPRSKNGSKISSLVSLNTREGGGKVAPVLRHSNSQTARRSAITVAGGKTRARTALVPAANFVLKANGLDGNSTTTDSLAAVAIVGAALVTRSDFSGMFIGQVLRCFE